MNYIFLVPEKRFGAVERQTLEMALKAKKQGHRVIIVCNNNSKTHHYANKLNFTIEFIHTTNPYIDAFAALELSLLLKKYEINVCVVAITKYLAIAVVASKFNKYRTKVFLYQQLQSGLNKKDFYHNFIYSRLSGAVVLTEKMYTELIRNTIIDRDKVRVIPYGIDAEKYYPDNFNKNEVRKIFNLPVDKYIVGNIARVHKAQDQISIIRSFHAANLPNSILVLCMGDVLPDQDYHLKVVQEVDKLNILDRVVFLPSTEKIPELMNSFDLYLLASRSETFSFALIEAIASGLPVIAVSSGGIPEVIKHDYNGYLVVRSDIDKIVEYMHYIFDHPEIVQKFKDINLSLVKQKFDSEKQATEFLDFVK